jgi:hypothetical protein
MTYGMYTIKGEVLVDAIVDAGKTLIIREGASPEEAFSFCERKLELLSNGDGFAEAFRPAVRNAVYESLNLVG